MAASPGEVTQLLAQAKAGNEDALAKLIPIVYKELRRLAGHYMRGERLSHTLQPTALVHEAYLRLLGQDRADWQNHAQFMAETAKALGMPIITVKREWAMAKAWLRGGLSSQEAS